jgi:predicted enzyme related to lactoylglutathione lyase
MSGPDVEIADITFDCYDPERVATFWSLLLGRPIAGRKGPYVWLERGADVGLGFQRVAETKVGKNRLHLDVSGPDIGALKERVEDLGGHRVDGYDEGGFLVMADPEGNEFCVVPSEPVQFDDEGRTNYLERLRMA